MAISGSSRPRRCSWTARRMPRPVRACDLSNREQTGYARGGFTRTRRWDVSVSIAKYENFVGGEWVDAAEGETMEVLNPATGETIAEVPAGRGADVDRAVEAAKKALPEWLETTPGERAEVAAQARRRCSRRTPRSSPQLESQNVGKPLSYARDEIPVGVGQPALLRRRRARARGPLGRRVHARLHVDDPARAARDRRRDRAVELPADDGGLEDRARARGRQRPGAQAVRADAADDAALRASSPRRSCRRACST